MCKGNGNSGLHCLMNLQRRTAQSVGTIQLLGGCDFALVAGFSDRGLNPLTLLLYPPLTYSNIGSFMMTRSKMNYLLAYSCSGSCISI